MSIEELREKLAKNEKLLSSLKEGMSQKVNELNDKYQKEGEQLLQISNYLIQASETVLGIIVPYSQICDLLPKLTLCHEEIKKACNGDLSDLLNNCEKQVKQFKQIFVKEPKSNDSSVILNTPEKSSKLPVADEIIQYISKIEKENNKSVGPSKVFNYFYEQYPDIEQNKVKRHVKKIIDGLFENKQLYKDNNSLTTDSTKISEKTPVTSTELLEFINAKLNEKPWLNTIEIYRMYSSRSPIDTAMSELELLYTDNKKNLIINEQIQINKSIFDTMTSYITNNQLTFDEIVNHYSETIKEDNIKAQVRIALFNLLNQNLITIKDKKITYHNDLTN